MRNHTAEILRKAHPREEMVETVKRPSIVARDPADVAVPLTHPMGEEVVTATRRDGHVRRAPTNQLCEWRTLTHNRTSLVDQRSVELNLPNVVRTETLVVIMAIGETSDGGISCSATAY